MKVLKIFFDAVPYIKFRGGIFTRKLFGTDGVRGVANKELTPELAFNLGKAGIYILTKEMNRSPKVLVGMDTRVSGDMLEAALIAGMLSVGADAVTCGVIPAPAVAHLVREYNCDAGVVISASHNQFSDNGIKFFNSDGYKLKDELEDEIEDIIFNRLDELQLPVGKKLGKRIVCETAVDDYVEFLKSTLDGSKLDGLKVAIDCANGATYESAPLVLFDLGAETSVIHNEPDGFNINEKCGSTHLDSLVEFVKENNADIGIAFDGDGDRLMAVDENGEIVDGDQIMAVYAKYLHDRNELKGNTLVATVMSNLGLFIMGKEEKIHIEQTAVGDRYVLERMLEGDFMLGGEQSGHIINLKYNTTGDGILSALQLLKIMKETGKKLSELTKIIQVLPQVMVNAKINNEKKRNYMENEVIRKEIEALEKKFSGEGRVLIRPSGTEPLVRVMIEGKDKAQLQSEAEHLAALLEQHLG